MQASVQATDYAMVLQILFYVLREAYDSKQTSR